MADRIVEEWTLGEAEYGKITVVQTTKDLFVLADGVRMPGKWAPR